MANEDLWQDYCLVFPEDENLSDQIMVQETHANALGEEMSFVSNIASAEIMALKPNENTLGEQKSLVPNIVSAEIMAFEPNEITPLGEQKSRVPNIASAEIMALEPNEITLLGEQKSLVNEKYIEELNMYLFSGDDNGPNEVDDGSVRARKKGKFDVTRKKERRVLVERERRKKMSDSFDELHVLLPQLPAKVAQATILKEATSTIKYLEETCDSLEKHIQERLQTHTKMAPPVASETRVIENDASMMNKDAIIGTRSEVLMKNWWSPNVSLCVFGDNASVNICSVKNNSFFTSICYILKKHKVGVRSASIYSDHAKTMYLMRLYVNNGPFEVAKKFCYEDLFKFVAANICDAYNQITEAPKSDKIM